MKAHTRKATLEDVRVPARTTGERNDSGWFKVTVRPATTIGRDDTNVPAKEPGPGARGDVDRTVLSALRQAPGRASEVPVEQIPALVAELASEQAALSAIQGMLTARLLMTPAEHVSNGGDRLLTAAQVAGVLGVTKRWVQRRARRLPFSRRISVRSVRYSEAGLNRWMANRQMPKR